MKIIVRRKADRHLLFLGLIPSVIFMALVIFSLSWVQEIYLSNAVQSDLNSVFHMFYGDIYEEAKLLNVLSDQLVETKGIQDTFMAGDREGLQAVVLPIFLKIKADYGITQVYFHSLDKTNFLRVYNPDHFGDIIDRFTLQKAEQTGLVSYGLELGDHENLTLRVVLPWRINDQVVGYVELGKEISRITQDLKRIIGNDLILLVNKSFLDQELWQEKVAHRDRAGEWDQFPESVVIDSTMDKIPAIISDDLSRPHHEHQDIILEINIGDKQYLAGFAPLLDAADRDIGDIIIIKDFSEIKTVTGLIATYILAAYFVCVLVFIIFVVLYLRHVRLEGKMIADGDAIVK